jgi:hypothetical protein
MVPVNFGLLTAVMGSSEFGLEPLLIVLDGCPMFAPAYMGRKWVLPMLSLYAPRMLAWATAF